MVVNLAAGLDTRPYRMELPPSLRWVEVDLPDLLDYKESILEGERPGCRLDRIRLDISDRAARNALLKDLGTKAKNVLIVTEGLIVYLSRDQVCELAADLAAPSGFRRRRSTCSHRACCACCSARSSRTWPKTAQNFSSAPRRGPCSSRLMAGSRSR